MRAQATHKKPNTPHPVSQPAELIKHTAAAVHVKCACASTDIIPMRPHQATTTTTTTERRASATKWQRLRHVGAILVFAWRACMAPARMRACHSPPVAVLGARLGGARCGAGIGGGLAVVETICISRTCFVCGTRHCSSRVCVCLCTEEIMSTRFLCGTLLQAGDVVACVFGVSHISYRIVAAHCHSKSTHELWFGGGCECTHSPGEIISHSQ